MNCNMSCDRYINLILHFNARTDDSRALPANAFLLITAKFSKLLTLVRLFVDYQIKPHIPPFEHIPANFLKFQPCDFTIQVKYLRKYCHISRQKLIF